MNKNSYIKYKIQKLQEEGYNNQQSTAIAYSYWNKKDKKQEGGSVYNYSKSGDQNIAMNDVNKIDQATGIMFTPQFAQSYFSTQSTPQTQQQAVQTDISTPPIRDITSNGQWSDRKVWRTQRPEWFLGKKEPVEGVDYNVVPYSQWQTYQNSPEYQTYTGKMQQGGQMYDNNYAQQGAWNPSAYATTYPSMLNNFTSSPYLERPQAVTQPDFTGSPFPSSGSITPATNYLESQYQFSNPDLNLTETERRQFTNQVTQPQTQYNDITRYNVINPYGSIDLSSALTYAGQGYGSGNYTQAGLGTGLSVLKGARNFLTGYASGKESQRVKNEMYDNLYNPNINYTYLQQGGQVNKITNGQLLTGQYLVDQGFGNVNLEGNEFVKRADTGDVQLVVGDSHIKNGKIGEGVDAFLQDGDKVLSNYTKIPPKNAKELKERYGISLKKNATFADAQKAYDKKIGVTKTTDDLSSYIEKFGKNSQTQDPVAKRLNDSVLSKEIEATQLKLNNLKEPQSLVFEELFQLQESLPKKGNPGELLDKNGKVIEETAVVAQQGGKIDEIAKKYGIPLERAQELAKMQQGGEMAQEQPVPQEQSSQQDQIIQFVAQSLQQGADPQQILEQLVNSGIPQDQATQLIEGIMQQLQQVAPEQASVPEQEVVQDEMVAQQGTEVPTGFSFSTRYTPAIPGYDVSGNSIVNQDVLSNVELTQPYTGSGYGSQMRNVEDTINLHKWYFDTEEKKQKFRDAIKKEGQQQEIVDFQNAYNKELRDRAEKAGIPKKETNEIVKQVGFSGKGVQKFDGLFGAFTSTRPLYDFTKSPEDKKEITIEAVSPQGVVETRNITKDVIPFLPESLRLAPSSLSPLAKEQVALGRIEPIKQSVEPYLAEQARQYQTEQARLQASGLPIQQQLALSSQNLTSSQMAANDAISKVEQFNAQSQNQADMFNIGQRSKEDITNSQFNQQYQNQMLKGIANEESAWRQYYNEANMDNASKFRYIDSLNLINAENAQYQAVPGQGVVFLNNRPVSLPTTSNYTQEQLDRMSPEEYNQVVRNRTALMNNVPSKYIKLKNNIYNLDNSK